MAKVIRCEIKKTFKLLPLVDYAKVQDIFSPFSGMFSFRNSTLAFYNYSLEF